VLLCWAGPTKDIDSEKKYHKQMSTEFWISLRKTFLSASFFSCSDSRPDPATPAILESRLFCLRWFRKNFLRSSLGSPDSMSSSEPKSSSSWSEESVIIDLSSSSLSELGWFEWSPVPLRRNFLRGLMGSCSSFSGRLGVLGLWLSVNGLESMWLILTV